MARELSIGGRKVGDGHPAFITFEAGPTHNGVDSAIDLVHQAASSGADAVKFQIFSADKLVSDREQLFSYGVLKDRKTGEVEEISEPLYDILKRRELSRHEWQRVKDEADKLELAFFATVGFEEDIELIRELKCDSIKIASADVDHFPLLRKAARTGLNLQLDTGSSDIQEIREAVKVIEKEGNKSIIIHQCPSGYPARIPSIYLNMITELRETFKEYPIAYSDHTPDADMDIAAIALGANLIEKTITHNRMTRSVEHIFSIETHELGSFIGRIRDVESAMGERIRTISEEQRNTRSKIRRSPYVVNDIAAGNRLSAEMVVFRRPAKGVSIPEFERFVSSNAVLAHDLKKGDVVKSTDFLAY